MQSRVVLSARLKDTQKFEAVVIERGRPVPPKAEVSGYYVRYRDNGKRRVQPVGKDLALAFIAYQNIELNHSRIAAGLPPIHGSAGVVRDFEQHGNRARISDAAAKYIAELEADVKTGKRSLGTLRAYKQAVNDFQNNCGVTFFDEITRDVLRAHESYLYENLEKRCHGKQANTVANRFQFLAIFFAKQGIKLSKSKTVAPGDPGIMPWSEVPRPTKKEKIDKYSVAEIKGMLSVATEDEADLIHTFLRTGCRDEEVAFLHWSDINWNKKEVHLSEKPKYGWKLKDRESRVIPLEDGILLERLAARRKRQSPASDLVFPNSQGSPDKHLIRQLHKVVAKMKDKGLEIEGEPTLHRFRRSFASMMIANSDLQTVSELLGHSDISTTARYLAPDREKARAASKTAFELVEK